MPLLAAWLGTLFGGLCAWLAQWLTKKVAFAAAVVLIWAGLTLAMYTACIGLLAGLSAAFPSQPMLIMGFCAVFPPNAPACISALVTAWATVTAYRYNTETLKLISYIT